MTLMHVTELSNREAYLLFFTNITRLMGRPGKAVAVIASGNLARGGS
jgi:hypothetical protein